MVPGSQFYDEYIYNAFSPDFARLTIETFLSIIYCYEKMRDYATHY